MAATWGNRLRGDRGCDGCFRCGGTAYITRRMEGKLAAVYGRHAPIDRVWGCWGELFLQLLFCS